MKVNFDIDQNINNPTKTSNKLSKLINENVVHFELKLCDEKLQA